MTKVVQIAAQVPKELADALKKRASESDRSVSAELRIAVKAHLENEPKAA